MGIDSRGLRSLTSSELTGALTETGFILSVKEDLISAFDIPMGGG